MIKDTQNDMRRVDQMQTRCRLDGSVFNNKQRWNTGLNAKNDDKCRCECKELID